MIVFFGVSGTNIPKEGESKPIATKLKNINYPE